jgi:hypothetical protein
LRGNGDGTFQAATSYAVGSLPSSVAVEAFRGNGYPDLVVTNYGSGTVSVLLGNGNGSFQDAHDYPAGPDPIAVAAGDLNGDGHPDLAVANEVSSSVSVLLGQGDGTFQTPETYPAGSFPWSVAVGDFDHNGYLDLAVANYMNPGTVSILHNAADWEPGLPAHRQTPMPWCPQPSPFREDHPSGADPSSDTPYLLTHAGGRSPRPDAATLAAADTPAATTPVGPADRALLPHRATPAAIDATQGADDDS